MAIGKCSLCQNPFDLQNKKPLIGSCKCLVCSSCREKKYSTKHVCLRCGELGAFEKVVVDQKTLQELQEEQKKKETKMAISNFPASWGEQNIRNMCHRFGTIVKITMGTAKAADKGSATVEFDNYKSTHEAISQLSGISVGSGALLAAIAITPNVDGATKNKVGTSPAPQASQKNTEAISKRRVYVINFPEKITADRLHKTFSCIGPIESCLMDEQKKCAKIVFYMAADSKRAMSLTNLISIEGNLLQIFRQKQSLNKSKDNLMQQKMKERAQSTVVIRPTRITSLGTESFIDKLLPAVGTVIEKTSFEERRGKSFKILFSKPEEAERALKLHLLPFENGVLNVERSVEPTSPSPAPTEPTPAEPTPAPIPSVPTPPLQQSAPGKAQQSSLSSSKSVTSLQGATNAAPKPPLPPNISTPTPQSYIVADGIPHIVVYNALPTLNLYNFFQQFGTCVYGMDPSGNKMWIRYYNRDSVERVRLRNTEPIYIDDRRIFIDFPSPIV